MKVTAYRYSLGQLGLETVEMSTWKRSWRWNMAAPAVPRRYSTRKDIGLDTLWLNSAIWNHSDYLIKLSIFCQFQSNFIKVCFNLIFSKKKRQKQSNWAIDRLGQTQILFLGFRFWRRVPVWIMLCTVFTILGLFKYIK